MTHLTFPSDEYVNYSPVRFRNARHESDGFFSQTHPNSKRLMTNEYFIDEKQWRTIRWI